MVPPLAYPSDRIRENFKGNDSQTNKERIRRRSFLRVDEERSEFEIRFIYPSGSFAGKPVK